MKNADIELDHIGIAVPAVDTNGSFWRALGWGGPFDTEVVSEQKVKVAMLGMNNSANIELLEPVSTDSAVQKFMDKRGAGIHHICFRVRDIEDMLKKLKLAGVKLINESPVDGAHNCRVAFIHPSSTGGVLVELSQKKKGAE